MEQKEKTYRQKTSPLCQDCMFSSKKQKKKILQHSYMRLKCVPNVIIEIISLKNFCLLRQCGLLSGLSKEKLLGDVLYTSQAMFLFSGGFFLITLNKKPQTM